jgi:cell shape-determining protein MreC
MIVSFRHDKNRLSRRRKVFAVLFLFALALFLFRDILAERFGGVLARIGGPIWTMEEGILGMLVDLRTITSDKILLEDENQRLRAALALSAVHTISNTTLRAENIELKRALGRASDNSLLLARVLSRPDASPYDTLLIDVGEHNGVVIGMHVLSEGDLLIGEVVRVWKESALVQLYSAPGSSVPVELGSSSTPAIAHGSGGGVFRITVPKGMSVPVGAPVRFPDISPLYLGVVEGVLRSEESSLQTLFVRLPFGLFDGKFVYVRVPVAPAPILFATTTPA